MKWQGLDWRGLRSEDLLEQVHYPVTASVDELAEDLLQLDKLLVEGFEVRALKEAALELPRFRGQWARRVCREG